MSNVDKTKEGNLSNLPKTIRSPRQSLDESQRE